MKKKSVWELFVGDWNTKTIVGIALGAALFGVLMNYGSIKVTTNTNFSTAFIVPVIVGA
jgi:energy-coupling factor transport system substrate-specific component